MEVSLNTNTFFTARGVSVLWDKSKAQFVHLGRQASNVDVAKVSELSFDGEEIEEVVAFDDDIFILTRIHAGDQWKRLWQRRPADYTTDIYQEDTELNAYMVRAFSLDGMAQKGPPLRIPQRGVQGLLRAGPQRVIVKIVGPQCIAGFWQAPNADHADWLLIHSELTWDPDVIAKEMGFQDAQEELDHLANPESEERDELREDFLDEETLDYAFLSGTLVARLRESAEYDNELNLRLEVFELPLSTSAAPSPILLEFPLPWDFRPVELSNMYLSAEPSFSESRCLSVCINSSGNTGLVILNANKIRDCASHPPATPVDRDAFCFQIFEDNTPFIAHMARYLAPSTSHPTILFATADLDPEASDPTTLLLRFVLLPAPNRERTDAVNVDIPLLSLITADDVFSNEFIEEYQYLSEAPFAIAWDGVRTVCIVFRRSQRLPEEQEPKPRLWYIRLSEDVLARLKRDA